MKKEIANIVHITKTFKVSKKQQKETKMHESHITAVNDLSFKLYEGEIYGLLGPNGAGKTTTLRMLATLVSPDSGEITIDGTMMNENANLIRSKIGFMTSELKLDGFFSPDFTFDYFAKLYDIDEESAKKRKDFLFAKFGIDEYKHIKISNLSTGMKQKVSLVISIIHDPKVIIFDEPTNGLDIVIAKVVEDFLLQLKGEGKTLIISTHIFSLVEKLCDRVGIILNGKMVYENDLKVIEETSTLEEVFFKVYNEGGYNNA